jgi:hypothetical protein
MQALDFLRAGIQNLARTTVLAPPTVNGTDGRTRNSARAAFCFICNSLACSFRLLRAADPKLPPVAAPERIGHDQFAPAAPRESQTADTYTLGNV